MKVWLVYWHKCAQYGGENNLRDTKKANWGDGGNSKIKQVHLQSSKQFDFGKYLSWKTTRIMPTNTAKGKTEDNSSYK